MRSVFPTSTSHNILKTGDVLMKFNDTTIANDGTVPFRTGERIMYNYLISQKFVGDVAQLEVLREGSRKRLQVECVTQHDASVCDPRCFSLSLHLKQYD